MPGERTQVARARASSAHFSGPTSLLGTSLMGTFVGSLSHPIAREPRLGRAQARSLPRMRVLKEVIVCSASLRRLQVIPSCRDPSHKDRPLALMVEVGMQPS